jgi:hypothetical protein
MNEVKKEYKVVIDRSKWRTGYKNPETATGLGPTALENKNGFCCCLGFVCKQLVSNLGDTSLAVDYPRQLRMQIPCLTVLHRLDGDFVTWDDTPLVREAVKINDEPSTSVADKEAALLALFADTPIELEFVGEPTPYKEERAVAE